MKPKIAKLIRPRVTNIVERDRLLDTLDRDAGSKIIWISAPAGSGKTTLAANWLDSRKLPCLWYQADEGDRDVASFFSYFGEAAKYVAPRQRTPLPLFTAQYHQSTAIFTRKYFELLYSRIKSPFCIVIDNYQDVPPDSMFHDVIRDGVSIAPDGFSVVIISRADPPAQFSRLVANDRLCVITWDDMKFTLEESRKLIEAREKKAASTQNVATLHRKTEGWAAGLVLLTEQLKRGGVDLAAIDANRTDIFDYFAGEIFDKIDENTRRFLLKTSFLPQVNAELAAELTGLQKSAKILAAFAGNNFFTTRHALHDATYQYHPLFREFLLARVREAWTKEDIFVIGCKAALLLEQAGKTEEAVELYLNVKDWSESGRLICQIAPGLIKQGRSQLVRSWIMLMPADIVEASPWLLYWKSQTGMFAAPTESLRCLENAFNLFRSGNDRAGMFLSWAALIDYSIQTSEYEITEVWIKTLDDILKHDPSYPSNALEARITMSMFNALAYNMPENSDIDRWRNRAFDLMRLHDELDINQRVMTGLFLIVNSVWMGDLARASQIMKFFSAAEKNHDLSDEMRSLIIGRKALYYLFAADHEACIRTVDELLNYSKKTGYDIWDRHVMGHGICSALGHGDWTTAERYLPLMAKDIDKARRLDQGYYHVIMGWRALLKGDHEDALNSVILGAKYMVEVCFLSAECTACIGIADALLELGKMEESTAVLKRVNALAKRTGSKFLHSHYLLRESRIAYKQGNSIAGRTTLAQALALAREYNFEHVYWWRSSVMAEHCAHALEEGIETDYVRGLIRRRNLMPENPPIHIEQWPWPLMANTLGRFEIIKDEKPLMITGKAQQKPLALLKTLISLGGTAVAERDLEDTLWPDADGDMGHASFDTTLHRLRKLLGNDKALVLNAGRLSLDQRYCWVDAYAFERMTGELEAALKNGNGPVLAANDIVMSLGEKAFRLYNGDFLCGEDENPAVITYREKLRQCYLKAAGNLGNFHLERKSFEQAIGFFEKGLLIDRLAEEFYQGLMLCYYGMGRETGAVLTYDRCREALKKGLGLGPSSRTEALLVVTKQLNRPCR